STYAESDETKMAEAIRQLSKDASIAKENSATGGRNLAAALVGIAERVDMDQSDVVAGQLDQLSISTGDPVIRSKLDALAEQFRQLRRERLQLLEKQYQAVLTEARKIAPTATSAKELDGVARKASEHLTTARQLQSGSSSGGQLFQRAEQLNRFLFL